MENDQRMMEEEEGSYWKEMNRGKKEEVQLKKKEEFDKGKKKDKRREQR